MSLQTVMVSTISDPGCIGYRRFCPSHFFFFNLWGFTFDLSFSVQGHSVHSHCGHFDK